MSRRVLLTGISGYVAQHCAVELLKNGYKVRGSVRNLLREQEVRKGIANAIYNGYKSRALTIKHKIISLTIS